jgi:murein DD-endopeptidase MepM/ murein hydrolase activator NlpD
MTSWLALVLVAALLAPAAPAVAQVVRPFQPPPTPYGAGHRGVDLAAAPGEDIRAILDGVVAFSGDVAGDGWVSVDHGGGLVTTYGLLDPRLVAAGDRVRAGDVLGRLAGSAEHLDWGARQDGAYVDPLALLPGGWTISLVDPDAPLPALPAAPVGAAGGGGRLAWPVAGRVSSEYGVRTHPITGEQRLHAGLDIAARTGTPVGAAEAGVVRRAGRAGGYGLLVEVEHAGGLATRYAHLSRIAVSTGQRVTRGQLLGAVGSTGASTGPHLHFEVRVRGAPQNPRAWL